MANSTLPLSIVCNVSVNISAVAAASPSFNQGLIVGPSTVIPSAQRLRLYTSVAAMTTDGFTPTSPEYLSALLYFGQNPAPEYLWIGRQDLTAIGTVSFFAATEGTGYVVGDVLTVVQSGASGGKVVVTSIGALGAVTGVALVAGGQGTGYSVATGLVTTGGTGTGADVSIATIGETPLQALTACRLASAAWWAATVTTAISADHLAIAAYAQAVTPVMMYFFSSSDAAVLANTTPNVFSSLQTLLYNRAFGLYATTQGGSYPNNAYAASAAMGAAMGENTGLAGSYFTMKFKVLSGVAAEPLSSSQALAIEALNANLYVNYANTYNWLEQGILPNGQYLDEVLALDMLASDIQYSVVNLLVSEPSIPQSNAGQSQLMTTVSGACSRSVARGFVSPGTWTGATVLNLIAGTAMPQGYLCQSPAQSSQSAADRHARKALPIYVALIEAGAMHSVTIGCYVQR